VYVRNVYALERRAKKCVSTGMHELEAVAFEKLSRTDVFPEEDFPAWRYFGLDSPVANL
jgi:hypothetical protein